MEVQKHRIGLATGHLLTWIVLELRLYGAPLPSSSSPSSSNAQRGRWQQLRPIWIIIGMCHNCWPGLLSYYRAWLAAAAKEDEGNYRWRTLSRKKVCHLSPFEPPDIRETTQPECNKTLHSFPTVESPTMNTVNVHGNEKVEFRFSKTAFGKSRLSTFIHQQRTK